MSWILKVKEKFQAAHFLKEYKGKCEKIHGHTFYVDVEIEVKELDKTG
ncbi:MAG: 6-pyruvoyl tetrahydrobiopterin synthase, partial [Candidatus Aminicenantes bacterium]|nr:6-pyruvoyl tetrahydrobiopterin synthase [Candidatus Aminicenantes bacterium]